METQTMNKPKSWLWPDRTIGKRESKELREEHNRLVNSHAELLEALKRLSAMCPSDEGLGGHAPLEAFLELGAEARKLIAKAKGE